MSRMLSLFFLFVCLMSARADLYFASPRFDAGRVGSGMPLTHRFVFENRGPAAVTVTELKSSCGCLTPRTDRSVYGPGERGEVVFEVNTLTQPQGRQGWPLTVAYRDGDQPRQQTLEVHAELFREVSVEPAKLALYTDAALTHTVVVSDSRRQKLKVRHAQTASRHMQVAVAPGDGEGVYRVSVSVRPDAPAGRHEEVLSILTDDPAYPELRVPVTVVRREGKGVRAMPPELTVKAPPRQPVGPQTVLLQGRGDVVVERIDSSHPALTARWETGPGPMATLRILVDGDKVGEGAQGTLAVHLRRPAREVVTIPVVVRP